LVTRTKARYQAVQSLKAEGKGIKIIMRELELAKETVRRFYRADSVEELLAKPRAGRPRVLDAYKPYLHQRWNAGITNASALYREITEQGYQGSRGTLTAYLAPFRALGAAPARTPSVSKIRQITSWMLRRPAPLHYRTAALLPGSPQQPHPLAQLRRRRRQRQLRQSDQRQMYGRAKFDLLRKRVLLTARRDRANSISRKVGQIQNSDAVDRWKPIGGPRPEPFMPGVHDPFLSNRLRWFRSLTCDLH
jgi:hypothetical protein